MPSADSGTRRTLAVGDAAYTYFALDALEPRPDLDHLPFSIKVLLENLVAQADRGMVDAEEVFTLAAWHPDGSNGGELTFEPTRVLLQDFTGVPALVDLAAMRDAWIADGGDPARIDPLCPVELVIDHSVIADVAGRPDAFERNAALEFERNQQRYSFLRWGQGAFSNVRVVPPDTGIVHQVNLEYLARVVTIDRFGVARPDTVVGTDSYTTMINALGVLGWGVGGIEAEAAMLGEPLSMLVPKVVGVRLVGELPAGTTATDLVLTITEVLRSTGVVGKFVEFFGPGLVSLTVADRATIGNMSPEYGSTCAICPIDAQTLRYLRLTGRPADQVALVEAYAKEQGLFHESGGTEARYSEVLEVDLGRVVACLAGPARPQDRVPLTEADAAFRSALGAYLDDASPPARTADTLPLGVQAASPEAASANSFPASDPPSAMAGVSGTGEPDTQAAPIGPSPEARAANGAARVRLADGTEFDLDHGHVVIAAITSCTNTSNPALMVAAGLLARNAVRLGLRSQPWVKTSLAPGSKVVIDYYRRAGLLGDLETLGFHLVGFGCTTCIGNSGPLAPEVSAAIRDAHLTVCSVLSGNRNFEGRIHPECRMNYLGSHPLVVAYALAGSMARDLTRDALGHDPKGRPVYLRDVWPSAAEVDEVVHDTVRPELFEACSAHVFTGDQRWRSLPTPEGAQFAWDPASTYIRRPPYFDEMPADPAPVDDIRGARVLAVLGDSITTDHISPAGVITAGSPAARYLADAGVDPVEFNSYGSRRGNHEVMVRGTFANIRLRNRLATGTEGGVTLHVPDAEEMSIYDAAMRYRDEGIPLVVLAGTDYGAGSSRDWAAKGTALLGVRAVLAQSFERIHRSNLIGMGVLPLQFRSGDSVASLELTGHEVFTIEGISGAGDLPERVQVRADDREFLVDVRIDTPAEMDYYRHGGILPFMLRRLRGSAP